MGERDSDIKSARILNRIVSWTPDGIQYESEQRHTEIMVKQMGILANSKSVTTSGTRVKSGGNPGDEKELEPRGASIFRGIVERAHYVSQDRSDIKFATKELNRRMAEPRVRDVNAAKTLARYLSTRIRTMCHFRKQKMPKEIEAGSGFGWAGCLETRKSTSAGLIKFGTHIWKSWSVTQNTIALSSGEAEFYALAKAGLQGFGMKATCNGLGITSSVKVITNETAAGGMAQEKD